MPRAEITTTDSEGRMITREVWDARYDDDGLLYVEDRGGREIIRMTSPQFCSVHFLPRSTPTKCAMNIIQGMMSE
ncbi:hypothetical protein [Methanolobus sp. WCC5]|uniref:hypothetical protein n=1 Tax=Methanolobus sp. WCC5 TaxID=3125785 RepID=UPI00324AF0F9